jgi:putative ABC transport system permease protein
MKLLPLVWRNALRNRLRTTLTMLGIGLLIFVLVFVVTALLEVEAWEAEAAKHHRVVVQHSTGLATMLPIDLEAWLLGNEEIQSLATNIMKFNWFGGYYQTQDNWPANLAVDIEPWRRMMTELKVPDPDFERMRRTKNGVLVGRSLMNRYGWKIDQRVTLTGTFYPVNADLEIVGTFTSENVRQEEMMIFRWDYFDELLENKKLVGTYWMQARSPDAIPRLKELIDGRTRNSSDPTETITEKEFAVQFMQMMGNVRGLVAMIAGIVLVIMVIMTANTMAMSVRERVTEVAVMRTLGFRSGQILGLIVGESMLVSLLAAGAALGVSLLVFNMGGLSPSPVYFPIFQVQPPAAAAALGAALFCGTASALVPAVQAARRKIVDGLRQVN